MEDCLFCMIAEGKIPSKKLYEDEPVSYTHLEVTGGVHGANRLGGNAVADFTVFRCV